MKMQRLASRQKWELEFDRPDYDVQIISDQIDFFAEKLAGPRFAHELENFRTFAKLMKKCPAIANALSPFSWKLFCALYTKYLGHKRLILIPDRRDSQQQSQTEKPALSPYPWEDQILREMPVITDTLYLTIDRIVLPFEQLMDRECLNIFHEAARLLEFIQDHKYIDDLDGYYPTKYHVIGYGIGCLQKRMEYISEHNNSLEGRYKFLLLDLEIHLAYKRFRHRGETPFITRQEFLQEAVEKGQDRRDAAFIWHQFLENKEIYSPSSNQYYTMPKVRSLSELEQLGLNISVKFISAMTKKV